MKTLYPLGALLIFGMTGSYWLSSSLEPEMPDRNFAYVEAGSEAKIKWLTEYGHYLAHHMKELNPQAGQSVKFTAVNPRDRSVMLELVDANAVPVSEEDMAAEGFDKTLEATRVGYQKSLCRHNRHYDLYPKDTKISLTIAAANIKHPEVMWSYDVCETFKSPNGLRKLFGNRKN